LKNPLKIGVFEIGFYCDVPLPKHKKICLLKTLPNKKQQKIWFSKSPPDTTKFFPLKSRCQIKISVYLIVISSVVSVLCAEEMNS